MSTEKNPHNLNAEETSLDKSVQVEQILDFYKDKLNEESTPDTEPVSDMHKIPNRLQAGFDFFIKKIPALKDKLFTSKSVEGIYSSSYGLTQKGRMILLRLISLAVSLAIIAIAFTLAFYMPGNEEIYNARLDKLRSDEDYISLKSRHDALNTEVEELKISNAEKLSQLESIEDIDNTKAKLRTEIAEKTYELNNLNSQIASKRSEIEALDKEILSKAAPETIRTPGKYIVGKTIAAGRYYVTGTGKFMVATASGRSKVNTTLGSTPLQITLDNNDVVKFDSKVKFTTLN